MTDLEEAVNALPLTCSACPTQIIGDLPDGRRVNFRYSWGRVTIHVGDALIYDGNHGDSVGGVMPESEARALILAALTESPTQLGEFTAEIERRSVVVTCPDNGHGGALMPPGDDDEWMWPAINDVPHLTGIDGPTIQGAYVFHWSGSDLSDDEIKFQSVKILKEQY